MSLDIRPLIAAEHLAERLPGEMARGLEGSQILAIAAHVKRCIAAGQRVANLTIGDFDPQNFPIPDVLHDGIIAALAARQTSYPPAVGMPELRSAIRSFYAARLGLNYPEGSVQVGSGARPPIYAAFRTVLDPGDLVVYPVPTWNIRYYVYLMGARGAAVRARAENGFMPTAADLLPHLGEARVVVLNSPLNPAGTVIAPELLREICEAIVDENERRITKGERPVVLLYDQVYWQLTFDGHAHHSPVSLVPKMAPYTVHIDAISKCWAATGVRVGWAVGPPQLIGRMKPLVGHMGAWAARAEQLATAHLLAEPTRVDPFMSSFSGQIRSRLQRLAAGMRALADDGMPVEVIDPQGAIYLSIRFDLFGRTVAGRRIETDEDLRIALLEEAGVAVVPFTAFGMESGTGWIRTSVGTVTEDDIDGAIERLRALIPKIR